MATIITINAADKLNPDSRNNINTNFANLNAELITKLSLAGGTMTGNLNMNGLQITNLPAPSASHEPARKADFDSSVKLTGDQTVAGVKTFSSIPVVPDASFGRAKVKDNLRKGHVDFVFDTTSQYPKWHGVAMVAAGGVCLGRAGCLTKFTITDKNGTVVADTVAYAASGGVNRFTTTDKILVRFTSPDTYNVIISGVASDLLIGSLDTANLAFMMRVEFEYDDF